jgi:hypothetical protein
VKLGLFLLAGQFPRMTEAEALAGAVDNAVAADRAGRRCRLGSTTASEATSPSLRPPANPWTLPPTSNASWTYTRSALPNTASSVCSPVPSVANRGG